jgi:hypothetical protein
VAALGNASLGVAVELALAVLVVDHGGVDEKTEEDNTATHMSARCHNRTIYSRMKLTE